MRVLFCDHPEADFLAAILYMGLVEELGHENVIEYPHKPSYHGVMHVYPGIWGPEPGTTGPFAWMKASAGRAYAKDEIVNMLLGHQFDLVIVASPRRFAVEAIKELISLVGRNTLLTLVFVDGEDYGDMRYDVTDELSPHIYFKREYLPHKLRTGGVRVMPFPFASPLVPRAPVPKEIDVLFMGGGTFPGRDAVCNALRNELGPRFVGGVGNHFGYEDYLNAIAKSKIAISMRGHGYDTLRFWEITSFDTLLVADRLPIMKPHAFEDGTHAVYFDSVEEVLSRVRELLADDERRVRIAKAGNEHLRMHHTARARARQLIAASLG